MDFVENNIDYSSDNNIALCEVYFGKTKELLQAEKAIGRVRKLYKDDQKNVNFSKEIENFNRLIEKAFKLEAFNLIVQISDSYNAYTVPIGVVIDAPNANNLKVDSKSGFNYNYCKDSSLIVFIYSTLLFDMQFTDGEIMGIIMHEIGHNFQHAISPVSRGFSYIRRSLFFLTLPLKLILNPFEFSMLTTNNRKKYIEALKEESKKNNGEMFQMADNFKLILDTLTKNRFSTINSNISTIELWLIILGANAINNAPLFKDETLADNFATAYGYGSECMSAINKMMHAIQNNGANNSNKKQTKKAIKSIPFLESFIDLCVRLPLLILINIVDCHPNNAFRTKHQIDMLKRELEKSELDPKMKNKINSNIKDLEETLDDFTTVSKKSHMFTNAWAALLLTMCDGDLRGMLASNNFDEFDATYENNLAAIKQKRYKK